MELKEWNYIKNDYEKKYYKKNWNYIQIKFVCDDKNMYVITLQTDENLCNESINNLHMDLLCK